MLVLLSQPKSGAIEKIARESFATMLFLSLFSEDLKMYKKPDLLCEMYFFLPPIFLSFISLSRQKLLVPFIKQRYDQQTFFQQRTHTPTYEYTMTTQWKFLLAVTLITVTLSRANAVPAALLQRQELGQDLGPTGDVLGGDLDLLGLKRRQALDGLSKALDTNDLYDALTDTRKRSPLVMGSPVSVGGSSNAAPGVQTGGVNDGGSQGNPVSGKRSPLVFNSPVAVGGSSKSAPGVQTGGAGQQDNTSDDSSDDKSVSQKRSPLVLGSPVSVGGDSQAAPGAQTGGLGLPLKRDKGGGGGGDLLSGLPLLGGGGKGGDNILSSIPLLGGGGKDGNGGLNGLLQPVDGILGGGKGGKGGGPLSGLTKDLPIKRQGLDLGGLTNGLPLLGGGQSGDGDLLSGLTSSLPLGLKREHTGASTEAGGSGGELLGLDGLTSGLPLLGQGGPLSGLTSSLPLGLRRSHYDGGSVKSGGLGHSSKRANHEGGGGGLGDITNDIPFLGGGKGGGDIMNDIPLLGGGGKGGDNILSSIPFIGGGKGSKGGNDPLSSLTKDLPIKRQGLDLGGLTNGLPLLGGGQGGDGDLLSGLTSSLPLGLKREHNREHSGASVEAGGSGGGLLGLDGLTSGLPLLGEGGPLSGLTSSLPIKRKGGSDGLDISGLTDGLTSMIQKQENQLGQQLDNLPLGDQGKKMNKQVQGQVKKVTDDVSKDSKQLTGQVNDLVNQLTKGLGGDLKGMRRRKRSVSADHDNLSDSIEKREKDGNVKPHSVSEAPHGLPNGRTKKESTDVGAHLLGGEHDPAKLHVENSGKDATNNHGSKKEKTRLSSSIGGHNPTNVHLKHKNKVTQTGNEEGTKENKSDAGLQTGGGHATALDYKKSNEEKTDHESRR